MFNRQVESFPKSSMVEIKISEMYILVLDKKYNKHESDQ